MMAHLAIILSALWFHEPRWKGRIREIFPSSSLHRISHGLLEFLKLQQLLPDQSRAEDGLGPNTTSSKAHHSLFIIHQEWKDLVS